MRWLTRNWTDYSLDTQAAALGLRRHPSEDDETLEWRIEIRRDAIAEHRERLRQRDPHQERRHFDARRSRPCRVCAQ